MTNGPFPLHSFLCRAGDGLAIVQDQTILRAGSDGKGAAFVPASSSVGISVAFLTSAIARDYDTIEVTLPYAANVGGDGTAVSISGEDCSAMVEVLALGAADQPRVIDSCVLETPVLTITLETVNGTFAAGGWAGAGGGFAWGSGLGLWSP